MGYVYHFDGTSWQLVTDGKWGALASVAGSATHTWVVGNGVVLRWTGTTFEAVFHADADIFTSVWAADDSHAWAVGSGDGLVTWNGSAWLATPILDGSSKPIPFVDVAGSSANDVWALSGASLYHYDGSAWTQKTLPVNASHVWSEQPGIVWLTTPLAVYRGDGITWTKHQPASGTLFSSLSAYFVDVGGRSPTDVWAAGLDGLVYRYDGTHWTSMATGADFLSGDENLGRSRFNATPTKLWLSGMQGLLQYRP